MLREVRQCVHGNTAIERWGRNVSSGELADSRVHAL